MISTEREMKLLKRHTVRCRTSPYSRIYNQVFNVIRDGCSTRVASRLNEWIRTRLEMDRSIQERILFGYHVNTMRTTQSIGRYIETSIMDLVERDCTLAGIAATIKLRQLQWRILNYLWRPGGRLMIQNGLRLQSEMAAHILDT